MMTDASGTHSKGAIIGGAIVPMLAIAAFINYVDRGNLATAAPLAHAIMAASLLVAAIGDVTISVASLVCAGVAFGLNTPTLYAIGQTLAGPRVAGNWMGVQNCVANLAGIVAPIVTGLVVDRTGQYYWAFIIAACMAASGIIGWGVFIRRVEPLDWDDVKTVGKDLATFTA